MDYESTCPHCRCPAMSFKDKLLTGPIASTHCQACGKPVGISMRSMWPLFVGIIPVAYFLGGKNGFLDFIVTAIGIGAVVWWIARLPIEPR